MHLLIRADAGTAIGTGHIMRCLAIAQVWQDDGGSVHLAATHLPTGLQQRLRQELVQVLCIAEAPGSEDDARTTVSVARQIQAEWVILDGYQFTGTYQRILYEHGLRLLVLDDLSHADHHGSHLVLNANPLATEQQYAQRQAHTRLLLGPRYALLRGEFHRWQSWRRPIPETAGKLLVTLGGSDPHNTTARILHALQQVTSRNWEAVVVAGAAAPHRAEWERIASQASRSIQIVHNPADMPGLMAWADLAISAGGATGWELARMQLPALVLVTAANQQRLFQAMTSFGSGVALGDADQLDIEMVTSEAQRVIDDREMRERLARRGRSLVDGAGARRVVQALRDYQERSALQSPVLRTAQPGDAFALWQLANEPSIRSQSFRSDIITWDSHVDWFETRLADPQCRLWIFEIGDNLAAQIRYDRRAPDCAEISFAVAPRWRGLGLGRKLLMATGKLACEELGVRRIQGVVFDTNEPSHRAFRHVGFHSAGPTLLRGHSCQIYEYDFAQVR